MFSGVLTTPSDVIISPTGGGTTVTVTATGYVDSSGNLLAIVVQTTGTVCTPVTPDSLPSSVKIGDFGISSTMICDDNTTQSRNWRVEDAGNGNIKVILNTATKNQVNTIITVVDVTFTINSNGDIVAFKAVATLTASGFTLTYQST